jgi:acetyl-CoA C-acetyltransferase
MNSAYIIDAYRSPRGRGKRDKGALASVHPQELLGQVLRTTLERSAIDPTLVDDVVVGAVSQVGEQGGNVARNAVLAAGLPIGLSAVSVNRFCGSGLQAVSFAAMGVASAYQELVLAAGVESMSRVPMGSDGAGQDGDNRILRERIHQVPQGISADLIATLEGFSREQLDAWSLRSQRRAAEAIELGRFARSTVPIVDPRTGTTLLVHEEHPRPDTTAAGLEALRPSFESLGATLDDIALRAAPGLDRIRHVHTAGNSSGIVDGAAAVLVASAGFVERTGLKPRARIKSLATVGSDPVLMLTGPAPASELALRKVGMTPRDVDLWEINEAFAAVVLQTIRALDIDPERVNVNGGAIALGHPLGATGAMLIGTLLDELERIGKHTGVVTMCIGGGQGIAMVIERV